MKIHIFLIGLGLKIKIVMNIFNLKTLEEAYNLAKK